jgi:branched-chain amino acid transport system substrate-binding protein
VDEKRRWVFKTPQNDSHMSTAIVGHMTSNNVKTVAFIGFADAYGEGWYEQFKSVAEARKHQDRRQRALHPHRHLGHRAGAQDDGGQAGCRCSSPVRARRRRCRRRRSRSAAGRARSTRPTASPTTTSCASAASRLRRHAVLPAGPVLVAEQLPDSNPVKASAMAYIKAYEAAHGKGSVSTFGAHAWDSGVMLQAAVPEALKKAQPGTAEFRAALRDALENMKEVPGGARRVQHEPERPPWP